MTTITEDGLAIQELESPPGDLTYDDARLLTEYIRSTADALYVLLHRAHTGKAWKALGYSSFAAYAKSEFDISKSRAYQLLNQAKLVDEITYALPEGATVTISEAVARDLKSMASEIVPQVKSETEGMTPEDASAKAQEILEDRRKEVGDKKATQTAAPQDVPAFPDDYGAPSPEELKSADGMALQTGPLERYTSTFPDEGEYGDYDPDEGTEFLDIMSEAPGSSRSEEEEAARRDREGFSKAVGGKPAQKQTAHGGEVTTSHVAAKAPEPVAPKSPEEIAALEKERMGYTAIYTLYSVLGGVGDLPSPEEMIEMIPEDKKSVVSSMLPAAVAWVTAFNDLWDE